MQSPLVSIICLCYNQSRFVREAVESVLNQTHTNIQLIIVDDASTDTSMEVIRQIVKQHPAIKFISLTENLGNCKAFNRGLTVAKGEYFIDFAADDVLLPNRIETGVRSLQESGVNYGVHFSDAEMINEDGAYLNLHSERFPHELIPQGDIYKELINRYFICPPSMMLTRAVLEHLNGYDETLDYEDFDFLIRSSRKFNYKYSPTVLVRKRITKNAMAKKQFMLFSKYSRTTLKVCEKIFSLNRTPEEQRALSGRVLYEMKLNLRLLNVWIAWKFFLLWARNRNTKKI